MAPKGFLSVTKHPILICQEGINLGVIVERKYCGDINRIPLEPYIGIDLMKLDKKIKCKKKKMKSGGKLKLQ